MSVTVCQDDIFRTTEYSVTKLGMVMQHHEPGCLAEKKLFAIFKRSQQGLILALPHDFVVVVDIPNSQIVNIF